MSSRVGLPGPLGGAGDNLTQVACVPAAGASGPDFGLACWGVHRHRHHLPCNASSELCLQQDRLRGFSPRTSPDASRHECDKFSDAYVRHFC